jgi:uncharacterized repeat protein (TIGR03803 family)
LTAIASNAQTFTTLVNFDNTNGALPVAPPVQGLDGKFYGTTSDGGANALGTVFKITSTGQLTTLYSFCAQTNCTDGANPLAALLLSSNGDFYGTTVGGGTHRGGGGTVFKITPAGELTRLHSFCAKHTGSTCVDGAHPSGGLFQGTDGNFYGTTTIGGTHKRGTIFKITGKGTLM